MPKAKAKNEPTYEAEKLDGELDAELKKMEGRAFGSLTKQIETEFQLAWWFLKPKLDEWALRLKLHNNQKRDKEAVGDPLMFTILQTVLASLYSDRLMAEFAGREPGDEEVATNLNAMAQYDEILMRKPEFDYAFDWDACFFGRGLALMMEFDRKLMCPMPEVLDPMVTLRDPRAKSARGDARGKGGLRFFGREVRVTKNEMKRIGGYFNTKGLKADGTDITSLFDLNSQLRNEAQGLGDISKYNVIGDNADYRLLEWFTWWKGKPVFVTLSSDRKTVVRYTELDRKRGFPVIDRAIYPMAHDWDGVSIPDLTEDKQRARSVVQNLGIRLIKRELHPRYLFDTNKIKNRAHLDREEDKHIPVDGNPANSLIPAPSAAVKQEANWILEILDTAAQRATATPEIQQGVTTQEKRTLGEIQLAASKVDTRYSLSAKVFGWSERDFWTLYRYSYLDNFKADIDEKAIRITGATGATWRTLGRSDIVGNADPDISVESKVVSDARRLEKYGLFRQFVKDAFELQPQEVNVRYALRQSGKLAGFTKDEINLVLPPNYDELDADEENKALNKNEMAKVEATDDHILHLEIHSKAEETPAKKAHIEAHRKAMMLKRERPELPFFANQQQGDQAALTDTAMTGAANAGAGRRTPLSP